MTDQLEHKYRSQGRDFLAIKTDHYEYDVYYPVCLDNETTKIIVRTLRKRTFNCSGIQPYWGPATDFDVETASGLTNPIAPIRGMLGYDFESERILMGLGEWDEASANLECTTVKLVGIERDFSGSTVLQADLLTLAQTAIAEANIIKYYANFRGYNSKIVGVLGTYYVDEEEPPVAHERSCIVKYNGAAWSASEEDTGYNYIQELVEPIYGTDNTFYGWLTEGHGTNSHFVKADLSSTVYLNLVGQGFVFTTQPVYDMINHKVVWLEWGSGAGANQDIKVADPHATTGCTNYVDKSPTGTITDNEGNSVDLAKVLKFAGCVYYDGTIATTGREANKFEYGGRHDGLPAGMYRSLRTTLGTYNDSSLYDFLANSDNDDKFYTCGIVRTVDPTNKLLVRNPLLLLTPSSA